MAPLAQNSQSETLDVLIVGTGFSGLYLLYRLHQRKQQEPTLKFLAIDSADSLGGVWSHNTYPGSRVDIEVPTYSLGLEEIWGEGTANGEPGWRWSERFPGREELQEYFKFADRRLGGLGEKYCVFGTWVTSAIWLEGQGLWEVKGRSSKDSTETTWKAKWFLPCVGYAAKPYVPDFKGLDSFGGAKSHTAEWPKEGIQLDGKRVGVVGTGASGVQVIQSIAEKVKSLTVFQQTPATATPMQQRKLDPTATTTATSLPKTPSEYREFFKHRLTQWDGSAGSMIFRPAKSDPPETREAEFDRLWARGGFAYWTSNYMDLFGDKESNDFIYEYWKRQVRKRVHDPAKQEILAPDVAVYAYGTKRVPLEQNYYDVFNLDTVEIVDVRKDPIGEITEKGVKLAKSGKEFEIDVLVLATGFEIATGSFTQIDIRGVDGISLAEKWEGKYHAEGEAESGVKTMIGMAVSSFPNMLFPYGPQSPSNTCNGPLCAEVQGGWILDLIDFAQDQKSGMNIRVEALPSAEDEWSAHATGLLKGSLFESTHSYYFGDNVVAETGPTTNSAGGSEQTTRRRKREPLFYFGGVPTYIERLKKEKEEGYPGFRIG